MSTPSEKAEAIVDEALDLLPAEREGFLNNACGADVALREMVEALLQAHQLALPTALTKETDKLGQKIGPYKILQRIGEGGCGVVYMAEQEEPVRRRVALKVIKLGMDTKQVIARFEAERQALALMDHPNIAKVLDAGALETGRPYFVMELVRGTKITDYCDQNKLPMRKRLELFTQVCRAVQHAHQKGIIHRDLKPSNILVTLHDGVPVPKVIDFGIAKAVDQRLTDKTVFTAFEQFIGTPAYMSPEQAEMSGLDIDTRSDIYSLGVLLYELLTSRIPFNSQDLAVAGLDEMRRIIREKDPLRPSTKLSTLTAAEQASVASHRQIDGPKLVHLVRGDLDWIVMKCLEKDRTRRYETANGLALDLERHLHNEPVVACPPSRLYRFQKLVFRNKLAVTAIATIMAVLLTGVAISTLQAIRAKKAERESEQFGQLFTDMLEGVRPSVAMGRDTTLIREILDKSADRVLSRLKDQPKLEARLLTTIGEVYRALSAYDKAEAMHGRALAIRTNLWGEFNADSATSMDLLGVILLEQTKLTNAEPLLLKSLDIRKRLLGPKHLAVATSLSNLGVLRQYQGRFQNAENLHGQAVQIRQEMSGPDKLELAESLLCLSSILWIQHKDLPRAEDLNTQALAIRKKAFGEVHPDVADVLINQSMVYKDEGKESEAEATMREAIRLWRLMVPTGSLGEAQALNNLAELIGNKGNLAEAEDMARSALAMRRRLLGNKHDYVAQTLNLLAITLQHEGKFEESEKMQREQLDMVIQLHDPKHYLVVSSKNNLSWVLRSQHKLPEAETMLREALALHCEVIGPTNQETAQLLLNLGALCAEQGKMIKAEKLNREALAQYSCLLQKDDPRIGGASILLARFLCDRGRPQEALEFAQRGADILQKKMPDRWGAFNAQAVLGRTFLGLRDYAKAEPLLTSGVAGMERLLDTIPVDKRLYLREAIQSLATLFESTNQSDKAADCKKKLAEFDNQQK